MATAAPAIELFVPDPRGLAARLLAYVEEDDAQLLSGSHDDASASGRGASHSQPNTHAHGPHDSASSRSGIAHGGASGLYTDRSDDLSSSMYTEGASRLAAVDLSALFGIHTLTLGDTQVTERAAGVPHVGLRAGIAGADAQEDVTAGTHTEGQHDAGHAADDAASDTERAHGAFRCTATEPPFDLLSLGGRWEDAFVHAHPLPGGSGPPAAAHKHGADTAVALDPAPVVIDEGAPVEASLGPSTSHKQTTSAASSHTAVRGNGAVGATKTAIDIGASQSTIVSVSARSEVITRVEGSLSAAPVRPVHASDGWPTGAEHPAERAELAPHAARRYQPSEPPAMMVSAPNPQPRDVPSVPAVSHTACFGCLPTPRSKARVLPHA